MILRSMGLLLVLDPRPFSRSGVVEHVRPLHDEQAFLRVIRGDVAIVSRGFFLSQVGTSD